MHIFPFDHRYPRDHYMNQPLPKKRVMTKPVYKVGQELYSVGGDSSVGKCEMETWIVRTVRARRVTAICKNRWTWVKKSTKNGDWGWAGYIEPRHRVSWPIGTEVKVLHRTKIEAWKEVEEISKYFLKEGDDPIERKMLKTAQNQIKRLQ